MIVPALACAALVMSVPVGAAADDTVIAVDRPVAPRFAGTQGEQVLVSLVNRVRARQGIRPVRYSAAMSRQARPWARKLATPGWRGRLTHNPTYWQQVQAACRGESAAAENVAARHATGRRPSVSRRAARGLLSQYLNSPPHRANLSDPAVTHIAVATVMRRTAPGRWYVANVLQFARATSC